MSYGTVQAEKMTTESGYSLGAGNASSFKNRIINGGMVIDQRNAGASVTASTTGSFNYTLDRYYYVVSQASKISIQQNAGSVTPPTGFNNYLGVTSLASTSLGTSDYFIVGQNIEGFNFADFAWGTANAKPVTISFWARSSLTGNFSLLVRNGADNRSYATTYNISSANTWQYQTVTIPGDTSGTWVGATNGTGLKVFFGLGNGSGESIATGAWTAGGYGGATGAVSVVGTNGATLYLTGVQAELGTVATSFDFRSIGTELGLCQRYYETSYEPGSATGSTNNPTRSIRWFAQSTQSYNNYRVNFSVYKRASPTVSIYNPNTGTINEIRNQDSNINIPASVSGQSVTGFMGLVNNTSVGVSVTLAYHYTADSEL